MKFNKDVHSAHTAVLNNLLHGSTTNGNELNAILILLCKATMELQETVDALVKELSEEEIPEDET